MKEKQAQIEFPSFFREGVYISSRFDFIDPTNIDSISSFRQKWIESIALRNEIYLYRVNDIDYVRNCVEKANRLLKTTGKLIHYHRLDEPSYIVDIKDGEYLIKQKEEEFYNKSIRASGESYDDWDVIRSIENGNGDALGYGD